MLQSLIRNEKYINDRLNELCSYSPETFSHSRRVASLSALMGKIYGMNEKDVERLYWCGLLHDIGKLKTPLDILNKNAVLTAEEFEIIKKHATEGYELIKDFVSEKLSEVILLHHERLDGSGYPNSITEKNISFEARNIMLADVYDALTEKRSYKESLSDEVAMQKIYMQNQQFDQNVVALLEDIVFMGRI